MNAFRRVLRFTGNTNVITFVTITWDGKRLSITGVEGPKANGDASGSCGQLDVSRHNPRLAELWARWHLNDMRAGCEHQRTDPAFTKPAQLTLQFLTWGPKYHELREQALEGTMSPMDAGNWRETVKLVRHLTCGYPKPVHPKLWGSVGDKLLLGGLVRVEKTDQKHATRVTPEEHPEGLLNKPCATCGYEYGSKWLHEDVPEEVLRELYDMGPDAAEQLPACWRRS